MGCLIIHQVKIMIAVMVLLVSSQAMVQGARVSPSQYFVTTPATFKGVDVFDPPPSGCFSNTGGYSCVVGVAPLIDGDTATQPVDLSSQEYIRFFNPWNRTQDPTYFIFTFGTAHGEVTIATIGLSFLNYPTENISLPNLRVFKTISAFAGTGGTIIPYTLRGNGELSTDDQEVATVYLDLFPATGVSLEHIRIEISFSGLSNTDWFLLSEVNFDSTRTNSEQPTISFDQPDTSLQLYEGDTLQLTCTVTVDGLFEWEWMKDDQTLTKNDQIQTSLATRRTTLTVSDLCASDSGSYTCEAQHVDNTATKQSRTTAIDIPDVVQVRVDPQLAAVLGDSIALTCAVSGYDGDLNDITWGREGNPDTPLSDGSSKYTIERVSQTKSSRGDCSSVSVSVTLTIHSLVSGDAGRYICRVAGGAQATTLTITEAPYFTTSSSTGPSYTASSSLRPTVTPTSDGTDSSVSPGGSSDGGGGNAGAIAGGVVVGLVFIAALTAGTIIVITFLVKQRPRATKNTDLAQETVYEDADNIELDHQAGAIATELNEAYGHATAGAIATEPNEAYGHATAGAIATEPNEAYGHATAGAIATELNEAYGHATAGTTHTGQVTVSSQEGDYEAVDSAGLDDH